jgi:hypothetical protein
VTASSGIEPSSPEPLVVRASLYAFDPELHADRRLLRLLRTDIPGGVIKGVPPPAPRTKVSGPSIVIPVVGVLAAAVGVIEGQVGWATAAVLGTVAALCGVTAVDATRDSPHDDWMAVHAALKRSRRLAPGFETDEVIAALGRLRAAATGLPHDLAAGVALRRNTVAWGLVAGIRDVRGVRRQLDRERELLAPKRARADKVRAAAERSVAAMRQATPRGTVEERAAAVLAQQERNPHVVAFRLAAAQVAAIEERLATEIAAVAVLHQELEQLVDAAAAAVADERRGPDALAALLARPVPGKTAAAGSAPPPPADPAEPAPAAGVGPSGASDTAAAPEAADAPTGDTGGAPTADPEPAAVPAPPG